MGKMKVKFWGVVSDVTWHLWIFFEDLHMRSSDNYFEAVDALPESSDMEYDSW